MSYDWEARSTGTWRGSALTNGGWTATQKLDSFDCTIANLGELVCSCLDAVGARSVAEVGAEHGLFTEKLLAWAEGAGAARVTAVDPYPRERLLGLAAAHPELDLIQRTSHAALPELDLPDVVILDGDHNYFTVSEELRLIAQRADGAPLPLVLLHDIGWPLARRDSYHDVSQIPAEHRQPIVRDAYLVPGNAGTADRGLYYECTAAVEGGERNGVLTAVEDFVRDRPELRVGIVAPFFGLGLVWEAEAPWAPELERTLAPWIDNPILERVEEKRLAHLVAEFENLQRIDALVSADYELRFEVISRLLPMQHSSAIALAERLSRLRQGGAANFSREQLGDLLAELAGDDIDLDQLTRVGEPAATVEQDKPQVAASRQVAPDLG